MTMNLHLSPASLSSRFQNRQLPVLLAGLVSCLAPLNASFAATPTVTNIDSALQKLVAGKKSTAVTANVAAKTLSSNSLRPPKSTTPGRYDAIGRVMVHVNLDGTATLAQVATAIVNLKGTVLATNPTYRHGILAAFLPIGQIASAATIPGVRSLTMEPAPVARVGRVTSQGTTVLGTEILRERGITGQGITVGILSDSFNTAYAAGYAVTSAQQDVATGDLPVVNVLEDFPGGGDEGRAMCQVIHDEAPNANIAFATAEVSEVDFANNIVALRTQAGASVIADDVGYLDEPIFSDGYIAQAVNTVATSTTLPGKPAVYVSAAGNDGNNGYRSVYRNLTDAYVRHSGNHGNLKLNVTDKTSPNYLDPSLTAGGWFNWNPSGGMEPSTVVSAPGPTDYPYAIFLQWDDPFDEDHGVTVSYNFLVFDQDGNYLPDLSSTTNAFSVEEPIQAIGYLALGTNYQVAITLLVQRDPHAMSFPSTHHLALYTTLDGASELEGAYFQPAPLNVPNIIGHPNADGAIAAAAYDYSWRAAKPFAPQLENFTSPGPSTIYFDQNSKRLITPVTRVKPEVAGVDGVVTTFFGSPYYNYPYAFFGTSAAAPSIAGVAALMLQAGGGPGSLSPGSVKQILEATTQPRNSTPQTTQAYGSNAAGSVSVTAVGQSYFPNYLTVGYVGPVHDSVQQITIDGTAAGLVFDTNYFALESVTRIAPGSITVLAPSDSTSKFTIQFARGTFTSGVSFSFGVGQDAANPFAGYTQDEYGVGSEAEDLSYGATASAQLASSNISTLTLPFRIGFPTTEYSPADGFGLINGVAAVDAVVTRAPAKP